MSKKYIFHTLLGCCFLFFSQIAVAQTSGFVQDDIIEVTGITSSEQVFSLTTAQKQTTKTYFDGMGRPIQTIAVQASPLQNDLIQPIAYDNLGRENTKYLPYAGQNTDAMGSYRPNAISTDQPAFYNNTSQHFTATDGAPYKQRVFENSPMQRVLEAGMIGNGFQPESGEHYKTINYRANNSADGNILIWTISGTVTSSGSNYPVNSLAVKVFANESNQQTISFTDNTGKLVLKRQILSGTNLDTYYIYYTNGMLACVVPPKALSKMVANGNYDISQTGVNKLIFLFKYDNHARIIEKTVPAQGTVCIVYDLLNRPVLLQDANMAANSQWNYIRYDAKNRPVSQGIYTDTDPSRSNRAGMQAYVNTLSAAYNTQWYESRNSNASTGYYTANVFPTSATGSINPLAYAYFDDYTLGSTSYSYLGQSLLNETGATQASIKGMPTMLRTTTIGQGIANGTWVTKVIFYDKYGNPVQEQSSNQLSGTSNITDYKTAVYDFMGAPRIIKESKQTTAGTTTVQTTLGYDYNYRLKNVSQSYNGGATTSVAAYTYNELGQVIQKGLGQGSGTTYLQNLDLRYNIRGQVTSINNSTLSNDGGITNGETNDVFGMQLLYDQTDSGLGNIPNYSGKLSAVKWMSKDASGNTTNERSYVYSYDGIGRYTSETYAERVLGTSSFNVNNDAFDEKVTQYDANGNIAGLNRNAANIGGSGYSEIDHLGYAYDETNNPDQLLTVSDINDPAHNGQGFRNLTGNTTDHYWYDANGNLTKDPYKGLNIGYNVLNRTDKITVNAGTNQWIDYTYDANGNLLRKREFNNNGSTPEKTTDYVDGFVYLNNSLSYLPMPEGRVVNNSGTLTQEFIITDPQGNARVSFNNTGTGGTAKVVQENSYYGFGMVLPNSVVVPGSNVDLYNGGSEWQNDYNNLPDYYQTFYRNYDAALGRFIAVDPEAESAISMTSYQYAGNNPIGNNDPLGDNIYHYYSDGYLYGVEHDSGPDTFFQNSGNGNEHEVSYNQLNDFEQQQYADVASGLASGRLTWNINDEYISPTDPNTQPGSGGSSQSNGPAMDNGNSGNPNVGPDTGGDNYQDNGSSISDYGGQDDPAEDLANRIINENYGNVNYNLGVNENDVNAPQFGDGMANIITMAIAGEEENAGQTINRLLFGGTDAVAPNFSKRFAFGLDGYVQPFADEIGAQHLMNFKGNWREVFQNIIANPNNEIHFTLDGIDSNPMEMIKNPFRSGTNWELNEIYHSPAFENTYFHYEGQIYRGFDIFKIKP